MAPPQNLHPALGALVDDLNSFDDQYLNAADVHRLLEALDFFIGRGEDNSQWRDVPADEREEWLPYRMLRARLQEGLGMCEWDDAASWMDKALRSERRATLGRVRAEVEKLLNDARVSKNVIRQRLFELAERLENTRLTSPPPRPRAVQPASSHRDRMKEPILADNWRRRDADYEAQNKAAGNPDTQ